MGVLFWRGMGWLVPAVVFVSFIVTGWVVNLSLGSGYYDFHHWPKYVAVAISTVLIGITGWYYNIRKTDTEEVAKPSSRGLQIKRGQHNFIYIPMQYWVIIFPLLAFLFFRAGLGTEKIDDAYINAPKMGDIYIINKNYFGQNPPTLHRFGSMKVVSVDGNTIGFVMSNEFYEKLTNPKYDYRMGEMNKDAYFGTNVVTYTKAQLLKLRTGKAIFTIKRPPQEGNKARKLD